MDNRSLDNLVRVHPSLVRVVKLAVELSPYKFVVIEGVRDRDRQLALVKSGASKTMRSKHLLQKDGYGHAVDIVAVGDLDRDGDVDAQDRTRTWSPQVYREIAEAFFEAARRLGVPLRWGGEFKTFFDGPHFEL